MPSTFIPSSAFKEGSEKEWPAKLGGLDWDSTRIVFTKRTLLEFLRYTGTSVDPNFSNIAKLARYAEFGQLTESEEPPAAAASATVPETAQAVPAVTHASASGEFKPSRRVRSVPGGAQTFQFGDGSDEPFDAPPPPIKKLEELTISKEQPEPTQEPEAPAFRPSRRVRTGPGGPSSMATLWDENPEVEAFKPTRRVREGPGGVDSISQIF